MKVGEEGYVENSDLKFSRMVSMDDVFTVVGLKREKNKTKSSSASSQCVADYEDHVKDIEMLLIDFPNALGLYKELTPGYQREWARYIFSAKQQQTREKRQAQMVGILAQGINQWIYFARKRNKTTKSILKRTNSMELALFLYCLVLDSRTS